MKDWAVEYEKNQNFNALVAWLHSLRYKNIIKLFDELEQLNNGNTIRVVEIGCGYAKLYSMLNDRFNIEYTGIELNEFLVEKAIERYQHRPNFTIIHDAVENKIDLINNADVIIALETLEHIPEHIVVRIIEKIAEIGPRVFACSVPVEIGPAIWLKNIGSLFFGYVRHKEYTWKETFWAGLSKLDNLPSHGTGHKGFDWRWLAQTIRHNMKIIKIQGFPFGFLPSGLCTSMFFVAIPR